MNIFEAYDLTRSYRAAGEMTNCSHSTVARFVARRANGKLAKRKRPPRPSKIDPYIGMIEEWVSRSGGRVRADICQRRLGSMDGFDCSERTVRRAVAKVKRQYHHVNRRIYRPWIPEPGQWAQFDWADGPLIDGKKTSLFCAWLAWSRFRVIIPTWDRKLPTLFSCLDRAMRDFGGIPAYWLTDNQRAVTTGHIARIAVRNAHIASFAVHYGFQLATCHPYDPETKGGSEATVKIAKDDLLPRDTNLLPDYSSFKEMSTACRSFMDLVNGRDHRMVCEEPSARLAREAGSLHSLPGQPYTVAFGETRKVSTTSLIQYGNVRYSVPHSLVGEYVWVRREGDEIVAVADLPEGTAEVARHRCSLPGHQVIDVDHYPPQPDGPINRRPRATNKREKEFLDIGKGAHKWLTLAAASGATRLEAKVTEAVTLSRLHGKERLDKALAIAADHHRFGSGDIESVLTADIGGVYHRANGDWSLQAATAGWREFGVTRGRTADAPVIAAAGIGENR